MDLSELALLDVSDQLEIVYPQLLFRYLVVPQEGRRSHPLLAHVHRLYLLDGFAHRGAGCVGGGGGLELVVD